MPAGARLRNAPLSHPGPAPHPGPDLQGAVAGPGGRRPATARPARLGRGQGRDGPRAVPRPERAWPQRSVAAHLKARLGPGQKGREERQSRSPRSDSVPRRPQPLAPGACFQIASSSRGRVFFRRPEIRAPPLPSCTHVTSACNRATGKAGRREW